MKQIKKVYGPYLSKKDNRKRISILYEDGTRGVKTYAKHLMEQHLGRELDPETETVDHIDRDKTNDVLENLRIIDRSTHSKEDNKYAKLVEQTCILCGKIHYKTPKVVRHSSKQGKAGPFCGKSCAGKYGAMVQNGHTAKRSAQQSIKSEYYYVKKL